MKIDELEEITEIDIKDYIDFRENVKSNIEHQETKEERIARLKKEWGIEDED